MGILKRTEPGELYGVFLDHDLHQQARTEADVALSGAKLIDLICQYIDKQVPILVHSMNPAGAAHMVSRLESNGYDVTSLPFDQLSELYVRTWVTEFCEQEDPSE